MKQKKVAETKVSNAPKLEEESPGSAALNIVIGIAAVSIMALIIVWMMDTLL